MTAEQFVYFFGFTPTLDIEPFIFAVVYIHIYNIKKAGASFDTSAI